MKFGIKEDNTLLIQQLPKKMDGSCRYGMLLTGIALLTMFILVNSQLNLPEDEGEGLGFRLTRTLWDPYPWVSSYFCLAIT